VCSRSITGATLSLGVFLVLAGCAPALEPARYTVAEYRADAALRREIVAQCANDPGTYGGTPDCVNALQAERMESRGRLREQPPIGLDAESGM
jgi:hypothetical protein